MNMKRGLVLSLCTAMVAAMASPALAVVDVQLNLRYTNPANPTGGGTWDLLVKSSGAQGLAGIAVDIGGNLGVTGIDTPLAAVTPNAAVFNNTDQVFRFEGDATSTHIVAGDDLAGTLRLNVGKAGGPGIVAQDDLFPANSTFWDNSSLVASGSWTGARPTMVAANIQANEFNATGGAIAATLGAVSVRGDSVGVDGLKNGDANRSGTVNSDDFNLLALNFGQSGKTWDQGDFTSNGTVNSDDFNLLALNFGQTAPAPAAAGAFAAVPEPSTLGLIGIAAAGLFMGRRRA
jgi:hypothetical protein